MSSRLLSAQIVTQCPAGLQATFTACCCAGILLYQSP